VYAKVTLTLTVYPANHHCREIAAVWVCSAKASFDSAGLAMCEQSIVAWWTNCCAGELSKD